MQPVAKVESEKPVDLPSLPQFSKSQAAITLALLSAVFIASAVFAIDGHAGEYFTLCIFKLLFELPCPACGLSHSFLAMAGGDLAGAFGFNLLGPPMFLIFILAWLRSLCVLLDKKGFVFAFDKTARQVRIIRSMALAFALFGAVRILSILIFY